MRRTESAANRIALLAVLSVVAGLLVAGIALPIVGGLGLAAKAGETALNRLPTSLDEPPLAQHSVLRAADGSQIAILAGPEDRVIVPLSAVPEVMQKSIVAIEDNRFYEHHGVDIRGLLRAVKSNSNSGSYSQGASTITQQYVKNVLLEQATNSNTDPATRKEAQQAATEKSINRKLREARLAIALEKRLSKDQILGRYLNIAYFGEGVYGVGTAAQHYFGVPVQKLSLAQSALLAGLVNNPSGFDPVAHPVAAKDRRDTVLDAVDRYGFLPHAAVLAATKQGLGVHVVKRAVDPCSTSSAPYVCRYALQKLLADQALGQTQEERDRAIYEGGLNIYTTYEPRVQKAVDAGIAANVENNIRQVLAGVVEQPGTGKILAIGQNRGYGTGAGQSKTVFAAPQAENVGSTYKAITLAAAIEAGLPLSTSFNAPACLQRPELFKSNNDRQAGSSCAQGFSNAGDSESGYFSMQTGTWFSVNTYFIQLEEKVGVDKVKEMARRLGSTPPDQAHAGEATTLGAAGGVSVIDMATVYATLAAHGKYCPPHILGHVTTLRGAPVDIGSAPACHQAVDPGVADTVTSLLEGVLTQPGATGVAANLDRPAAGKTGTLDQSRGAWFIGYVPQFATAVGLFDPKDPNHPILPITSKLTGATYAGHIYGGDIPAQTWHSIMTGVLQGVPAVAFTFAPLSPSDSPTPTDSASSPSPSGLPDELGETPDTATTVLQILGYSVTVDPRPVDSIEPAGTVGQMRPDVGTTVSPGSTVTLFISDGRPPGAFAAPTSAPAPAPALTPSTAPAPATSAPATPPLPVSPRKHHPKR